jgi:hypothetical protein
MDVIEANECLKQWYGRPQKEVIDKSLTEEQNLAINVSSVISSVKEQVSSIRDQTEADKRLEAEESEDDDDFIALNEFRDVLLDY